MLWKAETTINSYQYKYRAKMYISMLRAAISANPDRLDLRRDLVVALRDDESWTEIINLLALLEESGSLSAELAFELGMAAAQCNEWERAKAAFEIAIAGGISRALLHMAFVFDRLGQGDKALESALRALTENPRDSDALEIAGAQLLNQKEGGALLNLCDDLWRQGGGTASLLAWRGIALAVNGQIGDVDRLVDYDGWCAHAALALDTIDNDRLAETVLRHPDLALSARYQATRGRNLRLENLASRPEPAIRDVLAAIRERIDGYVAARARRDHPVMALKPAVARLQGWALAVIDDGHELMHIHPGGWLTAVYYVRTPEGEEEDAGSIVFGPWPPEWERRLPAYPGKKIKPRAGDLLIFPSFMGHRTMPTGVADTRLCLVLDVVPQTGGA